MTAEKAVGVQRKRARNQWCGWSDAYGSPAVLTLWPSPSANALRESVPSERFFFGLRLESWGQSWSVK